MLLKDGIGFRSLFFLLLKCRASRLALITNLPFICRYLPSKRPLPESGPVQSGAGEMKGCWGSLWQSRGENEQPTKTSDKQTR